MKKKKFTITDIDEPDINLSDHLAKLGISQWLFTPSSETQFVLAAYDPKENAIMWNSEKSIANRRLATAAIISYAELMVSRGTSAGPIVITNTFEFLFSELQYNTPTKES